MDDRDIVGRLRQIAALASNFGDADINITLHPPGSHNPPLTLNRQDLVSLGQLVETAQAEQLKRDKAAVQAWFELYPHNILSDEARGFIHALLSAIEASLT